jgi:transposase
VPSEKDEDARRRHRERERLLRETTALSNRVRGLLATQGVQIRSCVGLARQLEALRRWDGTVLPPSLLAELRRMGERWDFIRQQIRALEAETQSELVDGSKASQQALQLQLLRGIAAPTALVLSKELFAWRDIRNRRQLGALAGMVGMPYSSGDIHRDQGISKAGSKRIRSLMVQLAWGWLRLQPTSSLSRWFHSRFGVGKRMRRVGIVALARKLLVAFWRFVEDGVVPDGAMLKAAT